MFVKEMEVYTIVIKYILKSIFSPLYIVRIIHIYIVLNYIIEVIIPTECLFWFCFVLMHYYMPHPIITYHDITSGASCGMNVGILLIDFVQNLYPRPY